MSNKKTNGSGNGHDPEQDKDKILSFPSREDRLARKQKKEPKKALWGGKPDAPAPPPRGSAQPFFNFGKIPPFTRTIVLIFLLVQATIMFIPEDLKLQVFFTFGFVPAYFTGGIKPFPYGAILSPVTHIFIHGGWMHLAFNSVMALSLGMFFEREFGTRRMAIFFFVCGLAGALCYFLLNPFSSVPVIGASGSISGLFGATIVLLGKRGGLGSRTRGPWPLIVFWIGFMVLAGVLSGEATAWQAHIGGFLAGIGLLYGLQSGKLRL